MSMTIEEIVIEAIKHKQYMQQEGISLDIKDPDCMLLCYQIDLIEKLQGNIKNDKYALVL